jgi:hypothetical protein
MYRSISISTLALVASLTLSAATIPIGVGGLTASYLNPANYPVVAGQPSTSVCAGASNAASTAAPNYNGCYVPASVGGSERAYQVNLFANATQVPAVGATTTAASQLPGSLSGGGANFVKVADANLNGWYISSAAELVVPVGVYGVNTIWTMLNDYWGGDDLYNTTVIFTFDDSSNGAGGSKIPVVETIALRNGDQIRSSINATSEPAPKTCTTTYTTGTCVSNTITQGPVIATTLALGATPIGSALVTAGNVFSTPYNTITGSTGAREYAGTSGQVVLDYQKFDFQGLHSSDYLVSITIRNQFDATQTTGTGVNQTRTFLSAISVEQVPEPSTIILSVMGLGALGSFRRRKA